MMHHGQDGWACSCAPGRGLSLRPKRARLELHGATAHRRGGPHYEPEIDVQRRAIFPSCLRLQTKLRFHTVAIGVKLLTRSWVDGGSLAQQGLHSIREFPFLTHE
jgi:hypothetical protein